jgi:very-short-patch-repair endonuclease
MLRFLPLDQGEVLRPKLAVMRRIGDRRYGVVTLRDLERCGFTRHEIEGLVRSSSLIRMHRAVFRLPGSTQSLAQRAYAAAAACPQGAVVSSRSSAELWELIPTKVGPIHVTIPRGRRAEHAGIVVHRSIHLPKSDVTTRGHIPITRVARTIADLKGDLQEDALDEAIRKRLITPAKVLGRSRALNKLALDRLGLGTPHGRIERLAIAALRAYGLPDAIRQHPIAFEGQNYYIDLAYPDQHLAIELEGEAPHWGTDRFQYGIDRRNALECLDWKLLTFTWEDVSQRPEKLGRRVSRWVGPS